jgi:NCS1 family nucleobase:cation symporter-1
MTSTKTRPSAGMRRWAETHHIEFIPASARHGKAWHQLGFWWGSNVNVFNVVLGGVVVSIGLTFWWAEIAITVGTLIGAVLIALHATQGPRLGVPQTIQSRGQFGFYGATFMFPCVLALNIGFIAAQFVIQAQSLRLVTTALTIPQWIALLAIPSAIIGIYGYRWIHASIQGTAVAVTIALAIMGVQALRHGHLPAAQTGMTIPHAGLFGAGVALLVIDMLSFGPFVSDYTRYLPEQVSGKGLFWAIYAGNVTATIATCSIGAYITALLPSLDPVTAIGQVSGKWALILMAVSLVDAGTFNAYTGAFQVLAIGTMFRRVRPESVAVRVIPFLAVMTAGVIIALLGWQAFVTNLGNFLDVLLMVFIPWSTVNITDYYAIRHGHYDVPSFFHAGGIYGRFAWPGLAAYVLGLAAEWPFVSQPDYTGPLVHCLGGADISWIIGWIIPALAYLLLARADSRVLAGHAAIAGGQEKKEHG